ncbi:MAG: cytidylate kinase-like family protein [Bacteroidaceae bacterium]|nr:cytidylate kinase-like family protein [Bacteroidaceae bacterium]
MTQQPFAITIGRSLGSGGRYIGKRLAELFGAAYFDKEILSLAARESGLSEAVFESKDEHKGFLRATLDGMHHAWSLGEFGAKGLTEETLFRVQSDAIRSAAEHDSCVFIGRCADYVLREHPRLVSVFVAADQADRVRLIMQRHACDEREAHKLIEQGDRARANFYNFYSDKKWGDAATYDLCINSSRLGLDRSTTLIAQFVAERLGLQFAAKP